MKNNDTDTEYYSLTRTGSLDKLIDRSGLNKHRWTLSFILLAVAWLPLVIITAINRTLYNGPGLNFIEDYTMQGRLLIGIPMMVMIKDIVYSKISMVLQYFTEVLMSPHDSNSFKHGALQNAKKNTDSVWRTVIIIALVIAVAISPIRGATLFQDRAIKGSWLASHFDQGQQVLSLAGIWVRYISIPIFQYLLVGWLWRYVAWVVLLFRISRIKLALRPTHPDSSGGLGIIQLAQRNFTLVFFTIGVVISCALISKQIHDRVPFEMIRIELLGYIILSILLLLFPLFFFNRQLIDTKIRGKLDLSKAGVRLSKKFEEGWVKPLRMEDRVADDAVDSSIQVDYYTTYMLLQDFRIVPVTLRDIFYQALMLFAPFLPILFIEFSIADLLEKLMYMLV